MLTPAFSTYNHNSGKGNSDVIDASIQSPDLSLASSYEVAESIESLRVSHSARPREKGFPFPSMLLNAEETKCVRGGGGGEIRRVRSINLLFLFLVCASLRWHIL
jgi:hypothetical protein